MKKLPNGNYEVQTTKIVNDTREIRLPYYFKYKYMGSCMYGKISTNRILKIDENDWPDREFSIEVEKQGAEISLEDTEFLHRDCMSNEQEFYAAKKRALKLLNQF